MRTITTVPNIFTKCTEKTIHWYVNEMYFVIEVIAYFSLIAWKHTPDVNWVKWTIAELKFWCTSFLGFDAFVI